MTSTSRIHTVGLLAGLALLTAACGEDGMTARYGAECNPLGGTACITPWPSAIYEVADSSTPTGMRPSRQTMRCQLDASRSSRSLPRGCCQGLGGVGS